MAFQSDVFGLNLWRFLSGIGVGVELVTIDAYLSELVPKELRGRAFALNQTIQFSAVPVVALLAWLLVPRSPFGLDGWRWVVLIGAAGAVFVWCIRRDVPESPRWLAQQGKLDEAQAIVAELETRVAMESGFVLPHPAQAEEPAPRGNFAEIWKPPYRRRTLMLIVFNVFQIVGYYGFSKLGPDVSDQARNLRGQQPGIHVPDRHRRAASARCWPTGSRTASSANGRSSRRPRRSAYSACSSDR